MEPDIRVRRVYDPPGPQDGTRVLVDRLWPRGLRKEAAGLDEWARDVAPSSELRTWYGHDPAKFSEFCRRYTEELSRGPARSVLDHLASVAAGGGPLTLLTATRDIDHSQAAVLARLLRPQPTGEAAEGGEAACWAHLVCPECGAITTEGHRPGCAPA
jgi:uncharacterized protein YeaO (DUF488 family)